LPTINPPTVTTASITDITQTTASGGGNATNNGGATVTARGICWSLNTNPSLTDDFTTDGSGTGSFTSSLTGLNSNTEYFVRAYATNSEGTAYGDAVSFTTLEIFGPCEGTTTINHGGQVYNTIEVGSQCWFKENLNIGTMIDGSIEMSDNGTIEKYCNNDDTGNCDTYGALYQWGELMQYSTSERGTGALSFGLAFAIG
jgi:hypothetical protein